MQVIDGRLVLNHTDLTKHLACAHVTTLDREVAEGRRAGQADGAGDLGGELAAELGRRHEQAYLGSLREQGSASRRSPRRGAPAGRSSDSYLGFAPPSRR